MCKKSFHRSARDPLVTFIIEGIPNGSYRLRPVTSYSFPPDELEDCTNREKSDDFPQCSASLKDALRRNTCPGFLE